MFGLGKKWSLGHKTSGKRGKISNNRETPILPFAGIRQLMQAVILVIF